MAVEGGSTAPALPLPPRLSASSPHFVGMLLTGNPSKNLALGREEGKEDEGGGLLVRRRRRTSSPPVRGAVTRPSPRGASCAPCPVALPSPRRSGLDPEGGRWGLKPGRNGVEGGRTGPISDPGHPKRTTIPAQTWFQTGSLHSGRIGDRSGPDLEQPNEA